MKANCKKLSNLVLGESLNLTEKRSSGLFPSVAVVREEHNKHFLAQNNVDFPALSVCVQVVSQPQAAPVGSPQCSEA